MLPGSSGPMARTAKRRSWKGFLGRARHARASASAKASHSSPEPPRQALPEARAEAHRRRSAASKRAGIRAILAQANRTLDETEALLAAAK